MEEIRVFENSEFGELEVLSEEGKMYFPASACAKKLGYTNPRKAIADHCRCVTKRDAWVQTSLSKSGEPAIRKTSVNYIPEGDLYRLIVHSKLPGAERFEKWVFDEVLPTIRRTGGYAPDMTGLIVSTVQTAVTETIKAMMPIFLSPKAQKELTRTRQMRRLTGVLDRLEPELQCEIQDLILHGPLTYQGICDYLYNRYGIKTSTSALGRYANRLFDQIETQEDRDDRRGLPPCMSV